MTHRAEFASDNTAAAAPEALQSLIDSMAPENFATLFDYNKAIAAAQNGGANSFGLS